MSTIKELKPGKRYQAISPKGHPIIGTYDLIPGCALVRDFSITADGLEPEYAGETKVYWDGQTTDTNEKGEKFYQCSNGDAWTESELTFEEIV